MKGCAIILPMLFIGLIAAGILIYGSEFDDWFDSVNGNPKETEEIDNGSPSGSPSPSSSPFSFIQCDNDNELCCNGLVNICDKRINEIMFAVSHNAMSTVEDNFIAANHLRRLETSLENGYRGFMLDLCRCDGAPSFCHSSCFVGERSPAEVFTAFNKFLSENLSEVIILEFQVEDDGDLFGLYSIMQGIEGFVDRIYVHNSSDDWPLMSTLVNSDKRILLFQHDGENCNVDGNCPEGFLSTYTHMFQTSFEIDNIEDLLDTSGCAVTRGMCTSIKITHHSKIIFGVNCLRSRFVMRLTY